MAAAMSLAAEVATQRPVADRSPTRVAPASAQADAQPEAPQVRLQPAEEDVATAML